MLQSFSRTYLEAIDQAHLGMSDTVAGNLRSRRSIATRYDKLARNFLAGVQFAAVTILLN
jgi:transposase